MKTLFFLLFTFVTSTGVHVAFGERFDDSLKQGIRVGAADVVQGVAAQGIGDTKEAGHIGVVAGLGLHGIAGAGAGAILGGRSGILPGAVGAMVGEGVAEITHGTLDTKTAAHVGKFSGSLAAAAVDVAQGLDGVKGLSIGAATASTAVENNFMRHAVLAAYRLAKSKMGRKALEKVAEKLPKRLKDYIREVELKSGVKVTPKQRELLAKDLRETKYKKMDRSEYEIHKGQFTPSKKKQLIGEWEKMGGNTKVRDWPRYSSDMKNVDGTSHMLAGKRYQAHHINPQQLGGKHEWWNLHPMPQSTHQSGVHGSGSVLNRILRGLGKS